MEEFAKQVELEASAALTRLSQQELTPGTNPILELVSTLLADETGGVRSSLGQSIATNQWLRWNDWRLHCPERLIRAMREVLNREEWKLPTEEEAMRSWATDLLLETLEQIETP